MASQIRSGRTPGRSSIPPAALRTDGVAVYRHGHLHPASALVPTHGHFSGTSRGARRRGISHVVLPPPWGFPVLCGSTRASFIHLRQGAADQVIGMARTYGARRGAVEGPILPLPRGLV